MGRNIYLYFKHQASYLLFLVGVFIVPLFLYMAFSPYKAAMLPTVVLGALVVSQYGFHNEKDYRKKIEVAITAVLKKEFGRVPSRSEIIQRSTKVLQFRGLTIVLCGLCILGMMVLFKQF